MRFDPNDKAKAEKEIEVLYKDDYTIFVRCTGRNSLSYYLPHSVYRMWYDTWAERGNEVYFVIQKNGELQITNVWSILKIKNGEMKIRNDSSTDSWTGLVTEFPQLKKVLYETFQTSSLYETLKRIDEGFEYDKWGLNRVDDCISDIKFNKSNPKKSFIKLKFTDEEYLSVFYGDSHSRDVELYQSLSSYYHGYDFRDRYSTSEDWDEGYLFRSFNPENIQKYKDVVKYFYPLATTETDNEKIFSETVDKFTSMFSRETDSIIDEYHEQDEECRKEGVLENFEKKFCEILMPYGIIKVGTCFRSYVTTVRNLISMYEETNMQGFTFLEMLRGFVVKHGLESDDDSYEDNIYDYWCSDWDSKMVEFNRRLSGILDNCLEKIEDSDYFSDLEQFKKITSVVSKYGIDKFNYVPHSKNLKFKIQDVDPQTNKIKVLVWKGTSKPVEVRSYTLDEFNNFLHSPGLFD